MKNITILNAYGFRNIGDAAIQKVSLDFIKEAISGTTRITILCENPKELKYKANSKYLVIKPLRVPYGYAIKGGSRPPSYLLKLIRFSYIIFFSLLLVLFNKLTGLRLPKSGFFSYINEIKKADSVLGMGGGYFISKNKYSDYFGLLLTLLPIYIAKIYKKNIVFLPMSVGPFASKFHLGFVRQALKNTTIMYREDISGKLIRSINKDNKISSFFSPDMALFYKFKNVIPSSEKYKGDYVVLTGREWFSKERQDKYEKILMQVIEYLWNKHNLRTVFMPMAFNPAEDDDNRVANRIIAKTSRDIFSIHHVSTPLEAQRVLNSCRISICTRMHSALLSATVRTPFISIGYGHKTLGIVRELDVEDWFIDINKIDERKLIHLVDKLLVRTNYYNFIDKILIKQKFINEYRSKIINEIKTGGIAK